MKKKTKKNLPTIPKADIQVLTNHISAYPMSEI